MSPWLFNVYKDGVVREVNVRGLGKGWSLGTYHWCYAFGKQEQEIGCIIDHVWCKRTIS